MNTPSTPAIPATPATPATPANKPSPTIPTIPTTTSTSPIIIMLQKELQKLQPVYEHILTMTQILQDGIIHSKNAHYLYQQAQTVVNGISTMWQILTEYINSTQTAQFIITHGPRILSTLLLIRIGMIRVTTWYLMIMTLKLYSQGSLSWLTWQNVKALYLLPQFAYAALKLQSSSHTTPSSTTVNSASTSTAVSAASAASAVLASSLASSLSNSNKTSTPALNTLLSTAANAKQLTPQQLASKQSQQSAMALAKLAAKHPGLSNDVMSHIQNYWSSIARLSQIARVVSPILLSTLNSAQSTSDLVRTVINLLQLLQKLQMV